MSRRWAPSLALPAAIPEDEALGAERRDADEPAPATRAQLDAAEAALRKMEADLDAIGASLGGASPERRRSSGGSASSESSADDENVPPSWGDDAAGRVLDRCDRAFDDAPTKQKARRQTLSGPIARRKVCAAAARGAAAPPAAAAPPPPPPAAARGRPASPVYDIASATTPESLLEARSRMRKAHARLAEVTRRGDAAEADCAFVCGVTAVSHECAPATATCAYADANYDHGAGVLAPEPPRGRERDDDGDDALAALGICSVAPSSCTVM